MSAKKEEEVLRFKQHQDGDLVTLRDTRSGHYLCGAPTLKYVSPQLVRPAANATTTPLEWQLHHYPALPGWLFLQAGRPSPLMASAIRPFLFYDSNACKWSWVQRDPTRAQESQTVAQLDGFLFRLVFVSSSGDEGKEDSGPFTLQAYSKLHHLASVASVHAFDDVLLSSGLTGVASATTDPRVLKLEVKVVQHTSNPSSQVKEPLLTTAAATAAAVTNAAANAPRSSNRVRTKTAATTSSSSDGSPVTTEDSLSSSSTASQLPWWAWFLLILSMLLFFALVVILILAYQRGYRYVLPEAMPAA